MVPSLNQRKNQEIESTKPTPLCRVAVPRPSPTQKKKKMIRIGIDPPWIDPRLSGVCYLPYMEVRGGAIDCTYTHHSVDLGKHFPRGLIQDSRELVVGRQV